MILTNLLQVSNSWGLWQLSLVSPSDCIYTVVRDWKMEPLRAMGETQEFNTVRNVRYNLMALQAAKEIIYLLPGQVCLDSRYML